MRMSSWSDLVIISQHVDTQEWAARSSAVLASSCNLVRAALQVELVTARMSLPVLAQHLSEIRTLQASCWSAVRSLSEQLAEVAFRLIT